MDVIRRESKFISRRGARATRSSGRRRSPSSGRDDVVEELKSLAAEVEKRETERGATQN